MDVCLARARRSDFGVEMLREGAHVEENGVKSGWWGLRFLFRGPLRAPAAVVGPVYLH